MTACTTPRRARWYPRWLLGILAIWLPTVALAAADPPPDAAAVKQLLLDPRQYMYTPEIEVAARGLSAAQAQELVDELVAETVGASTTSSDAMRRSLGALGRVLRARGPLPDGAPPAIVGLFVQLSDIVTAEVAAQPRARMVEHELLLGNIGATMMAADGPSGTRARWEALSGASRESYAQFIRGAVLTTLALGDTRSDAMMQAMGFQWTLDDALPWFPILVDREVSRIASCDAAALQRGLESREMGMLLTLMNLAMSEGPVLPEIRLTALEAFMTILDACDARAGALGIAPVRSVFTHAGYCPEVWEVMTRTLGVLAGVAPFNIFTVDDIFDRLAHVGFDAMSPSYVARIIRIVDWIAIELSNIPEACAKEMGICAAVARLTNHIAGIPHNHVAWTAANRCIWIAAVDRDRSKYADALCEELKRVWIDARASVPVAWREECTKAAQEKAAASAQTEQNITTDAKPHAPTASTSPAAPHKED